DSPIVPPSPAMVVKLVATIPVSSACPGASTVNAQAFANGLAAWGTTPQPSGFFASPPEVTETAFTPSTLAASEVTKLAVQCTAIHPGVHACRSCPLPPG